MKRVSIITWYSSGNYGTTLQAFALHKKLQDLGYDVSILKEFEFNSKSNTIKYILTKLKLLNYFKKRKYSSDKRKLRLYKFISDNINVCEIFSNRQLKKLVYNTDVFITGSDQIWNAWFCYNPFYFLNFAANKKRIAYATSIGTKSFPDKYKKDIKKLLSQFNSIAVREKSAINIINDLLEDNSCIQVVDPTFLLEKKEWEEIASKAVLNFSIPSKYILCYLIGNDNNYKSQLEEVKQKTQIENVIIIPSLENPTFSIDNAIVYNEAGPLEFVNLIQNAALVCTDSFHATTISIISSVKFVEFKRFKDEDEKSQNSRIYDLLNHYNISYLLFNNNNDWLSPINFKKIEETTKYDRKNSINYLIKSIEN